MWTELVYITNLVKFLCKDTSVQVLGNILFFSLQGKYALDLNIENKIFEHILSLNEKHTEDFHGD